MPDKNDADSGVAGNSVPINGCSFVVKSRLLNDNVRFSQLENDHTLSGSLRDCTVFLLPLQLPNEGTKMSRLRVLLDEEGRCIDSDAGRRVWRLLVDASTVLTKLVQLGFSISAAFVASTDYVHTWTVVGTDDDAVEEKKLVNDDGKRHVGLPFREIRLYPQPQSQPVSSRAVPNGVETSGTTIPRCAAESNLFAGRSLQATSLLVRPNPRNLRSSTVAAVLNKKSQLRTQNDADLPVVAGRASRIQANVVASTASTKRIDNLSPHLETANCSATVAGGSTAKSFPTITATPSNNRQQSAALVNSDDGSVADGAHSTADDDAVSMESGDNFDEISQVSKARLKKPDNKTRISREESTGTAAQILINSAESNMTKRTTLPGSRPIVFNLIRPSEAASEPNLDGNDDDFLRSFPDKPAPKLAKNKKKLPEEPRVALTTPDYITFKNDCIVLGDETFERSIEFNKFNTIKEEYLFNQHYVGRLREYNRQVMLLAIPPDEAALYVAPAAPVPENEQQSAGQLEESSSSGQPNERQVPESFKIALQNLMFQGWQEAIRTLGEHDANMQAEPPPVRVVRKQIEDYFQWSRMYTNTTDKRRADKRRYNIECRQRRVDREKQLSKLQRQEPSATAAEAAEAAASEPFGAATVAALNKRPGWSVGRAKKRVRVSKRKKADSSENEAIETSSNEGDSDD